MGGPVKRLARGALTVALAAALVAALCACGGSRRGPVSVLTASVRSASVLPPAVRPASIPITVTTDTRRTGSRVPREFLGLSFEVSALAQIARYGRVGDFAKMLRSLGGGLLRFGGISADTRTAWTDAATPLPGWASSGIARGDLRALRVLAEKSRWHVLLTLGLAHYDPRAAAREAAAAKAALGGWLAGIEIGNEPDAYAAHHLRSTPWTSAQYDAQVTAYRRAIAKVAPGLALLAPDASGSRAFETWGRGVASGERPALLTGHHYPLGCHMVPAPTIPALLSRAIRRAEGVSLHRYLSVSRARHIGFRLDEANTVSCGGKAGISNTFASALWAVDYIAHTMVAGAAGINLQGAPANCLGYSPVCAPGGRELASGALLAQPEWYALLLSKALVGERPVRAISSPRPANVDVFAFSGPHGKLQVLVVDDERPGGRHASIRLRIGRPAAAATVLPLTAPAPGATTGVRLGGRAVEGDGGWSPPPELDRRSGRNGVITLDVSPSSAALVTVASGGAPRG
jgi:hypothetical protein